MTFDLGRLHFDLGNPWLLVLGIVLLVSLLLSSLSIYRRLFHRSVPRALAVLALNALAYLAVLLLLLDPRVSTTAGQAVVLVTEGADIKDSSLPGAKKVYVAPGYAVSSAQRQLLSSADWLLDIGQLNFRETAIGELDVLGYGLEREQWEVLAGRPEINFEAPEVDGFHAMRWQRFLSAGEILRVSGQFGQAGDNGVIEIRLLDPAGNSAATGRYRYGQAFRLETRIKTHGNLEYRLQAWIADELRSEQIVPLEAGAGDSLDIMIVQSAPSYETRQLKDYAAATGHRVRMSSVISKGKYIWQSANLPPDADTTFSPAVLAAQDILIMDGRAFSEMPPPHRQWLADAVRNGLGLLLLADNSLLDAQGSAKTDLLNGFELAHMDDAEPLTLPRPQAGGARDWQQPASVAAIRLGANDADVLMAGDDGRNLVVRRPFGLGNIGISLVSNSSGWLTSGQRSQWSDYWSLLLAALARQRSDSFLLVAADAEFYRLNRRTALCAMTRDDGAVIEVADITSNTKGPALELGPAADTLRSSRRCAFFWPLASGWHKVVLRAGSSGSVLDQKAIYVFAPDQWLDQLRDRRSGATRAWASGGAAQTGNRVDTAMAPLSVFYLWLTLVLSASLLWLERKLDHTW